MRRSPFPRRLAVAAGVALSGALVAWAQWGLSTPPLRPAPQAPGMIYYRDPVTGRPAEPPPGLLEAAPSPFAPQAQGGWRQTPPTKPGEGWKLEGPGLKQQMVATVGSDGKLHVDCSPMPSGEGR